MADRIVKRRGGHRAEATKLIHHIGEACKYPTSLDHALLRKLITELSRQREIVLKLDDEILNSIDEADFSRDISEASTVIMKIDDAVSVATDILSAVTVAVKSENHIPAKNVKLPTIVLPTFDGSVLKWQHFWDLFHATIHIRTDISGASKFHYLLSQLTGDAAQLMIGFNRTDAEYDEAVRLLESTYGNPKRLVEAHLNNILDLSSPKATSRELGQFRSGFEGHLRGLKSLKMNIDDAGYLFSTVRIRKLPIRVRDNINREGRADFWDLDTLRTAFETEIGHLRSAESITQSMCSDSTGNEDFLVGSEELSTISMQVNTNRSFYKCQFFDDDHYSSNCIKYPTAETRRTRVMQLKLCFNCLRGGAHQAKDCLSRARCKSC
jgi:hypothetical protein